MRMALLAAEPISVLRRIRKNDGSIVRDKQGRLINGDIVLVAHFPQKFETLKHAVPNHHYLTFFEPLVKGSTVVDLLKQSLCRPFEE